MNRRPIVSSMLMAGLAVSVASANGSITPISFSTGIPDGKVGTRPASFGLLETETADIEVKG